MSESKKKYEQDQTVEIDLQNLTKSTAGTKSKSSASSSISTTSSQSSLSQGESAPHIHKLMEIMCNLQASDLHISSGKPIYYRLHGKITKLNNNILTKEECQILLFEILSEREQRQFIENWELDTSYGITGLGRFRINVFMQKNGLAAAVRLIPEDVISMEKLNLPPVLKNLSSIDRGLILVTGATGSGKSTTLASMINHINKTKQSHIITIEDPIEFVHKDITSIVNQRELGANTKSFKNALKSSLREDPDVILVGELRDLESISLALTAAETGHLVLSTLHSSNATSTIERMIDVFPPAQQSQVRTMLAESLKGVVSQKLFPVKNKNGRIAAFEVLINNTAVSNLIRENKGFQIKSVIQTGSQEGMVSFDNSITELVRQGLVEQKLAEQFLNKKLNQSE